MIILASGSPRREELLKKICAKFLIEPCSAQEITNAENPADLAVTNAKIKAETVAKKFPNDVVIGADTIVVLDGKIFGKPTDGCGAFAMLKELAGKLQGGTAQFIEKIHGDWSNVVGLPLYRLRLLAKSAGVNLDCR